MTKSQFQTWFRCVGRSRMHDPSPSQSLRRFGCFARTLSPSCRQIRSTRLWFTHQPSARRRAVILR